MATTQPRIYSFFFFQAEDGIRDVAVTGVQTCALPIYGDAVFNDAHRLVRGTGLKLEAAVLVDEMRAHADVAHHRHAGIGDRKSTRLNSSHGYISYAVFCLKKKKKKK